MVYDFRGYIFFPEITSLTKNINASERSRLKGLTKLENNATNICPISRAGGNVCQRQDKKSQQNIFVLSSNLSDDCESNRKNGAKIEDGIGTISNL